MEAGLSFWDGRSVRSADSSGSLRPSNASIMCIRSTTSSGSVGGKAFGQRIGALDKDEEGSWGNSTNPNEKSLGLSLGSKVANCPTNRAPTPSPGSLIGASTSGPSFFDEQVSDSELATVLAAPSAFWQSRTEPR